MSTYSSSTNELFFATLVTEYGDEGGGEVWRSRDLKWRVFGWEGNIDVTPPRRSLKSELRYFRYRFNTQHFPFEKDESYLAERYKEQK